MVRPDRFELPTFWFVGKRYIPRCLSFQQLSQRLDRFRQFVWRLDGTQNGTLPKHGFHFPLAIRLRVALLNVEAIVERDPPEML
jgi:hypothetical protein